MIKKLPDVGPMTAILPAEGWEDEVVRVAKTIEHVTVYRKEEIPERFHYKNNPRIMPVLIIADEGWLMSRVSRCPVKHTRTIRKNAFSLSFFLSFLKRHYNAEKN